MPSDLENIIAQGEAQRQLEQAGSVMAQPPIPQGWRGSPAVQTANDLVRLLNPINWMGGPATGAEAAGVFRGIGLARKMGDLNPAEYVAQLQAQPNYPRFKQLVEMFVRKGLGNEFPVARGGAQTDPLISALMQGQPAPATAVAAPIGYAKAVGSPTNIAEDFAKIVAEGGRKTGYAAEGIATPESVAGLLPTRSAPFPSESELVLGPGGFQQGQLTAKFIPPSSQFPWVERKPIVDPIVEAIQAALQQAQVPPKP